MLFFAFILLIGSSPIFGQACPTVTASDQSFCDSQEPQIGDLDATAGTETIAWYTSQTSNTALLPTQFLVNGQIYYAGTTDGSCTNNRAPVTVRIYSEPEILGINSPSVTRTPATRQSLAVIGICVINEEDSNVTIGELRTNYDDLVDSGDAVVNWYYTRTGGTPIDSNTEIIDNTDYFAEAQVTDPNIDGGSCTTNRRRTTVRLYSEDAPTGPSPQTFCASNDPTLADIEASGNNRYYTTSTSVTELGSNTPLVDGRTYYVSSVGEFCESIDRLEVRVEIQEPVDLGTPTEGIICESDVSETFPSIDAIRNYYLGLLPAGTPTDGTFNPTPAQLATQYQNDEDGLGSFFTDYTVGIDGCESTVRLNTTIIAEEDAEAGTIADLTLECGNEEPIVLATLPNDGGNAGGTFSGVGVTDGNFDPSVGPGTYEITYTVDDSAECVIEGTSDSTTFTITVPGSELGEPIVMEMCITEALALTPEEAIAMYTAALIERGITNPNINGFEPSLQDIGTGILTYINTTPTPTPSKTFETTYSETNECGEDSVLISLTINNTTAPEAGEITPAPVCASNTPFNLFSILGEDNDAGGTFSYEGEVVAGGLFDVSTTGTYEGITYTVTQSAENCTAGDDDSTIFNLTVNEGAVAESPAPVFVCDADVQTLFPSVDEIRKYYIAIAQRAGFPTNGTISPNGSQLAAAYQADEDGLGDFTTTYTFGGGTCQTSVDLTVTIVANADAGENGTANLTTEDEEVNLIDYLQGNPMEGGTWSNGDGMFDPATDEEGVFTYTVTLGSCEDSATVTVTVEDETDPTDPNINPGVGVICQADVQAFFPSVDEIRKYYLRLLPTGVPSNGTFNPTPAQLAQIYQADEDGLGEFSTEYTVNGESYELTVNIVTEAEAGDSNTVTLTTEDEPVNLFDYLGEDALQGGSWSSGNGMFDPATDEPGTYTYTVGYEGCMDSAVITVVVNDPTDPTVGCAGPDVNRVICEAQVAYYIANPGEAEEFFGNLIAPNVDQSGTFTPSLESIAAQWLANPVGTFTSTYTVNNDDCVDSAKVTIEVTEGDQIVRDPVNSIICESDVQALFPSNDEIRKYYLNLVPAGVSRTGGTFSPNAAQLASMYQNDADGLGDFTTTYTVQDGECAVSVEITATIVAEEAATLDPIEDATVCVSEDGLDLSAYITDNTMGGTFTSDNGTITGNILDVSEAGAYNITYTVDASDATTCLTGTASESFIITAGGSVDAGADNSKEVCNSEVRNLNTNGVRNLYLGLLETGVPTNGTFSPTINELITQYNFVSNYGDFETEYTIGTGDCTDSVMLTITVLEANDAGEDIDLDLCSTEDAVNLYDFLSPFATKTGTFEGYEDGMFDPATADAETVITYEVEEDESICSTGNFTSTFTITVTEPEAANAGEDVAEELCVEQDEDIQLTTLLTEGANLRGSFEAPFEDGTFNPSVVGEGVYEIDYTVDENDCAIGTATVTLTITVTATGETPVADAEQTFCLVNDPTVADLVVTGEGEIIIYEDAELTIPADETSPLVDGADYYAVASSGGNACGSDPVMITVILTDADAPTLIDELEGGKFCRGDNPTVQELINNLNGSGIQIYTSLTGGTALPTTTALEDGVTYFASATNSTTQCESSERRAVEVEVGFCGIPEGFSPNDDGINDEFVIPDIATDFPNYTIQVYNRWGSLVFEGNASTGDWDGLSNQSATLGDGVLPAGVYFYILDYNDGQTQPVQGKVYLLSLIHI